MSLSSGNKAAVALGIALAGAGSTNDPEPQAVNDHTSIEALNVGFTGASQII